MSQSTDLNSLLNQENLQWSLISNDAQGLPHFQVTRYLSLWQDDILYPEFGEHSRSNLNLLHSLWYDHPVLLTIQGPNHIPLSIHLEVRQAIIAGELFQEHYSKYLALNPELSLSTLWRLKIAKIIDESPQARWERDEKDRLPLIHLDRIAITDPVYPT